MIGKLKEVVSLSNEIRELKDSLSKVDIELKEIRLRLDEKSLSEKNDKKKDSDEMKNLVSDISKMKNEIMSVSKEYSSELNAFRITKKNIQEHLNVEFREESKRISSEMVSYLSAYRDLESNMKSMSRNVEAFNILINSLKSLSEDVLKKDFELKNYAKILNNNDREKVELLKRIDNLERMISTMKRSSGPKNQGGMRR